VSRFPRAASFLLPVFCLAGTVVEADQLAASRIGRCQDLVRREVAGVQFEDATWKAWDDPVPRSALTPAALGKVRSKDLLYDGGVTGLARRSTAAPSAQPGEIFAFCSFDNLFIWLQGLDDGGRWIPYGPADDTLPY